VAQYEGLEHGCSSVEEGVEQPAIVTWGGSLGGDGVDGRHYW
jgi:hypothetical protein